MTSLQSTNPASIEALVKTASAYPSDQYTPQEFVEAVAVRAFSLGLSENELRLFFKMQSASRPRLSSLLAKRSTYRRLIESCRAAARSSSPTAAPGNALKTARLTVGRILSPVPTIEVEQPALEDGTAVEPKLVPVLTAARQIRARATLAVLCVEQLKSIHGEKGWNTLMVSYPWLSLRMGVSWVTAKAALNDLVDLGWITEVGGARKDSARRFKISGRLTREQGQIVEPAHLFAAIGSLAGLNDEPARTADVIRSVTHPAWTYGSDPLTFTAWLTTLAHAAEVDPVQLGLTSRSMNPAKKALTLAGLTLVQPGIGDTTSVAGRLNEWAQQTGSFTAATQAKAAYTARTAERTADLDRVRAGRAKAKADLEKAFGPVKTIPAADAPVEHRNAWLNGAAEALSVEPIIEERRKALRYELTRRLKLRGYKGDTTSRVVEHLLSHAPALMDEDSIPSSAEEVSVKQQWLQGAAEAVAGRVMHPSERDVFSYEIFAKLRRKGYEKEKAQKLSELILGNVRLVRAA